MPVPLYLSMGSLFGVLVFELDDAKLKIFFEGDSLHLFSNYIALTVHNL
jgi:hypothetical protein